MTSCAADEAEYLYASYEDWVILVFLDSSSDIRLWSVGVSLFRSSCHRQTHTFLSKKHLSRNRLVPRMQLWRINHTSHVQLNTEPPKILPNLVSINLTTSPHSHPPNPRPHLQPPTQWLSSAPAPAPTPRPPPRPRSRMPSSVSCSKRPPWPTPGT